MKIIQKRVLDKPIHVHPTDRIALVSDGQEVCHTWVDREISINEVVIFDIEQGEFGERITDGIGGAFLHREEK